MADAGPEQRQGEKHSHQDSHSRNMRSSSSRSRRQYLAAVSAAATALVGCLGLQDDTDDSGSSEADSNNGTEADSTAPGDTQGPQDAEQSVETPVEGARAVAERLANQRFEAVADLFGEQYRSQLSVATIENAWLALTGVGGEFNQVVGTEKTVQGGFDAVDLRLAFARGEHTLRVLTERDGTVTGLLTNDSYRSPEYVETDLFATQETTLETDDCRMDACLTVPTGAATDSVPGVVLVHGNDPNGQADKNLESRGTQMFRDLAEGLTSAGVAVFRYDRRTNACPGTITPEGYTLDRVAVDDAVVAADQLRAAGSVDPDQVFVVGHSLGGLAMPRIVDRAGLAGGVALASPGREFFEIVIDQLEHRATVGEYELEQAVTQFEVWQDQIERVRAGDYQPSDTVIGYPGAFWDSVVAYDNTATAREIDTPLLFLQGAHDYQVTQADFNALQSALSDRPETRFRTYDRLNHLFMPVDLPSLPDEYIIRNNIVAPVIDDIVAWIRSNGGPLPER